MRPAHLGAIVVVLTALASIAANGCGAGGGAYGVDGGDDGGGGGDGGNPAGCPATSPSSGDACSVSAGVQCSYGCGQGGPSTATCTSGTWSVARSNIACAADAGGGGPIACGSTTCAAGQYCVNPCCGGAAPACEPIPDSGVCPSGLEIGTCTNGTQGCTTPACTPPPPFCVDDPKKAAGCQPESPENPRVLTCLCA